MSSDKENIDDCVLGALCCTFDRESGGHPCRFTGFTCFDRMTVVDGDSDHWEGPRLLLFVDRDYPDLPKHAAAGIRSESVVHLDEDGVNQLKEMIAEWERRNGLAEPKTEGGSDA